MSDFSPTDDRDQQATEHAAIQVDAHRIKVIVPLHPAEVEEANPKTWREVGKKVNDRLKSITVNVFDLVNEAVSGTRRLIKGATSIPGAAAKRIEGAHLKADQAEGIKQQELDTGQAPALPAVDAAEALERKLLALRASGYHVKLSQVDQESWIITAVRPEHADLAQELATNELKQLESHAGIKYFEMGAGLPVGITQIDASADDLMSGQLVDLSKLSLPISALNLSVRSTNCLTAANISTIGELLVQDESALLMLRLFGKTSLREVKRKLADLGLSLLVSDNDSEAEAR